MGRKQAGESLGHRQPQGPFLVRRGTLVQRDQPGGLFHALGRFDQALAGRGGFIAARVSFEQAGIQRLLQPVDAARDGDMRGAQMPCRPRKLAFPHNRQKELQIVPA